MRIIQHSQPTIGPEETEVAIKVLESGRLATGERVEEFEEAVAKFIGRKYAVATVSGTAALYLALIALSIKKGKVVLIPSYSCDALLGAVICTAARPAIFDMGGSPDISKRDAMIISHIFGFFCMDDNYTKYSASITIPWIEDCAQAIGGSYDGKMFGQFGTVSVFSFYATKMMTTAGMGGMLLTDDRDIADRARNIRHNNDVKISSLNLRMTDVAAAIGLVQLKKLPAFIKKRKSLFNKYRSLLPADFVALGRDKNKLEESAYYRFTVMMPRSYDIPTVINKMKDRGIRCGRGIDKPLHRIVGFDPRKFPVTEELWNSIISLPLYPSLTEDDIEYIVENFLEVIGANT